MIIGPLGKQVENKRKLQGGAVQNRTIDPLDADPEPLAQAEPVCGRRRAARRDPHAPIATESPEHHG
jgi:hypothetical protein